MAPFFTILTTTYNRKDLFMATFRSMSSQSFSDYEILIVDDGSTDGTQELLQTLANDNKNVRVILQPNCERGAARNTGIKNAYGNYVVLVDSDDIIDKNHLQLLHDTIFRIGNPDFVGTKFDFVRNGKHYPAPVSSLQEGYYDHKVLLHGNVFGIVFAIRRDNPALQFYEEDRRYAILEDWMFNFINFKSSPIYLIDTVSYHIIDHSERSMRSDNIKIIQRKKLAAEWILEHVELSTHEKNTLLGFTDYFCAIHSHLDYKDRTALTYLRSAIQKNGLKRNYLLLAIKCLAGRKNIERITSIIGRS